MVSRLLPLEARGYSTLKQHRAGSFVSMDTAITAAMEVLLVDHGWQMLTLDM